MENGSIIPAAWSILRWCVASCTAYLEEMSDGQCIQGRRASVRMRPRVPFHLCLDDVPLTDALPLYTDSAWRQFRFSVGAPDAEAKVQKALQNRTTTDANAKKYPNLYAFHGPALRSWHSIMRHGLWYRTVANGRTFGDGVYLAKEAQTSMGHYAAVVNLPKQFVSSNLHFVVKDTEWIMCRYLIKGPEAPAVDSSKGKKKKSVIPLEKLDPAQTITLMSKALQAGEYDGTDAFMFEERKQAPAAAEVIDISDDEPMPRGRARGSSSAAGGSSSKGPPKDDWKRNADYVRRTIELLMPPPFESSPLATIAVQRELKTMRKEQDKAMTSPGGLKELGWYMPQEFMGDNLFPWIVEMHSFDETLPIVKDLKREFPPTYPIGPPFLGIITPRFLPFIQGEGGHVTGGGSICMDLLTSDGWLLSYSISAVLMQIKHAALGRLDK
ncbi:UBIQUITIN-CONJUGAT-2 domain-containing protein [Mycena venus]|uniref:UBIQUITIN-CONJUGAT-2 domain-containing protein n=1 Tax=Mycena venus TaxID=2733690 RepID=A0A8H6YG11_9AGAR|nr:UBIQUITIN-CONJUGAT-2 domain-containing protein [Mycena venus]